MKSIRSKARRWVVPCLLLLTLALSSCRSSPEVKSARFIDAGKRLLKKKDVPRAILAFRNATQTTPKNPEAYYQLGLAYLNAGDMRNAVVDLSRAIELDPKHTAARLQLAQLMAGSSDQAVLKEAQQRLQSLLQDSPDNSDVLHALALTELKLGDSQEAMRHLERALSATPQELAVAVTLAEAKLQQKNLQGAEEVLKKACADSPKSPDCVVVLGRLYAAENRLPEAEQKLRQALSMDPNHVAALLDLAILQNAIGRKQEAEQSFKRLSGLPDKRFNFYHATFLFQEGRQAEALKEFEVLAKADTDDRAARTRLVAAYEATNRIPDAQKLLNDVLKKNPRDLDALLQRGELSLGAGKYDQAEADLNRVVHLKPDSAEVHYIMARVHAARGAVGPQRQELNEALRFNRFLLAARLDLAKELIRDGSAKAALDLLDQTPEDQRKLIPVIEQRNWALLSTQQSGEARQGVDRGLATMRTPELLMQDAILKINEKRYGAARESLHEAMVKSPEDFRLLRLLVGSYVAQNQVPAAVREVRDFGAQHPKSAAIQYFLGNLLLETGARDQAKQVFSAAKALNPDYTPVDLSLAQIDLLQADWKDARQELNTIISAKGENSLARLWLGMLEASQGGIPAAIVDFRKVLDSQPDNAIALNNLAFLLAENGQAPEALKYAERAVELAPDKPEYEDTLGWVLYRKGLFDAAVTHLQSAVSKGGDLRQQYHLAAAYFRRGDEVRGRAVLTAALRKDPNLPEAQLALQAQREANPNRQP